VRLSLSGNGSGFLTVIQCLSRPQDHENRPDPFHVWMSYETTKPGFSFMLSLLDSVKERIMFSGGLSTTFVRLFVRTDIVTTISLEGFEQSR